MAKVLSCCGKCINFYHIKEFDVIYRYVILAAGFYNITSTFEKNTIQSGFIHQLPYL